MTQPEIKELYQYNEWANRRVEDSILNLKPEQFAKNLNASHASIRGTFAHIAAAERIWLNRWKGKSPTKLMSEDEFPDVQTAVRRLQEIDQEISGYLGQLTEADLDKVFTYKTTEGKTYSSVLRHAVVHVINHSTYHRGQLAALMRQVGATPSSTDLILYYRSNPNTAAMA